MEDQGKGYRSADSDLHQLSAIGKNFILDPASRSGIVQELQMRLKAEQQKRQDMLALRSSNNVSPDTPTSSLTIPEAAQQLIVQKDNKGEPQATLASAPLSEKNLVDAKALGQDNASPSASHAGATAPVLNDNTAQGSATRRLSLSTGAKDLAAAPVTNDNPGDGTGARRLSLSRGAKELAAAPVSNDAPATVQIETIKTPVLGEELRAVEKPALEGYQPAKLIVEKRVQATKRMVAKQTVSEGYQSAKSIDENGTPATEIPSVVATDKAAVSAGNQPDKSIPEPFKKKTTDNPVADALFPTEVGGVVERPHQPLRPEVLVKPEVATAPTDPASSPAKPSPAANLHTGATNEIPVQVETTKRIDVYPRPRGLKSLESAGKPIETNPHLGYNRPKESAFSRAAGEVPSHYMSQRSAESRMPPDPVGSQSHVNYLREANVFSTKPQPLASHFGPVGGGAATPSEPQQHAGAPAAAAALLSPPRTPTLPCLQCLMRSLQDSGLLGTCWSAAVAELEEAFAIKMLADATVGNGEGAATGGGSLHRMPLPARGGGVVLSGENLSPSTFQADVSKWKALERLCFLRSSLQGCPHQSAGAPGGEATVF